MTRSANKLCLHTKLANFALSRYIHGESLNLSVTYFLHNKNIEEYSTMCNLYRCDWFFRLGYIWSVHTWIISSIWAPSCKRSSIISMWRRSAALYNGVSSFYMKSYQDYILIYFQHQITIIYAYCRHYNINAFMCNYHFIANFTNNE